MQLAKIIEGSDGKCDDRLGVFDASVGLVLVVADGAGGTGGAAEAAEMAISMVEQFAETLSTPEACCKLLLRIDSELSRHAAGGQTTCVIAVVSSSTIYGASIGDSAAWLIGASGVTNLTEFQMRKPLVGSGAAHPAPFQHPRLKTQLMLASDGLVKYTSSERIAEIVIRADVFSSVRNLVESVRYRSGALPDDIAVILVDLTT